MRGKSWRFLWPRGAGTGRRAITAAAKIGGACGQSVRPTRDVHTGIVPVGSCKGWPACRRGRCVADAGKTRLGLNVIQYEQSFVCSPKAIASIASGWTRMLRISTRDLRKMPPAQWPGDKTIMRRAPRARRPAPGGRAHSRACRPWHAAAGKPASPDHGSGSVERYRVARR